MTRIQKERFPNEAEYQKAAGRYQITQDILDGMRQRSIVLHPLPRAGEIDPAIDADPRAAYFRQATNGVYIRMALLAYCLESKMVQRDMQSLAKVLD